MRTILSEVVDIRTGYAFRGSVESTRCGNRLLVQMKNFDSLKKGKVQDLSKTDVNVRVDEWLLKAEDILLRGRGENLTPLLVEKKFEGALFTHPLIRLRAVDSSVLPGYLYWYFSRFVVQMKILQFSTGSASKIINLNSLRDLEIDIPSLSVQKMIVEVLALFEEEEKLLKVITAKKMKLMHCITEELMLKRRNK